MQWRLAKGPPLLLCTVDAILILSTYGADGWRDIGPGGSGASAHRGHLHEPAQAAAIPDPGADARQAAARHRGGVGLCPQLNPRPPAASTAKLRRPRALWHELVGRSP